MLTNIILITVITVGILGAFGLMLAVSAIITKLITKGL